MFLYFVLSQLLSGKCGEEMVAENTFARRLHISLKEFTLSVPPLRMRKYGDDIPALAAMFLQRYAQGKSIQFSPEAIGLLREYDYPGNVRELESAVKYALTVVHGNMILTEHLRPEIRNYQPVADRQSKLYDKETQTCLRVETCTRVRPSQGQLSLIYD